MARSYPDRRWRVPFLALALVALGAAAAERDLRGNIELEGSNLVTNLEAGTFSLDDVRLRQGEGTTIRASRTSATGVAGDYENSRWRFEGDVHIEFEGATLDADSATAVFAGGRLSTIEVTGGPARFTHPLKNETRRNQGRAASIQYTAATGAVRFSGNAWYSDGRNELTTDTLTYNLNDRVLTNERAGGGEPGQGRVRMTIRPGKPDATP